MNSDLSYLASKCFNLTSKNWSKIRTCPSVSLSVQYLIQSLSWIDFGHVFLFFCKLLIKHFKKRMTVFDIFDFFCFFLNDFSGVFIFFVGFYGFFWNLLDFKFFLDFLNFFLLNFFLVFRILFKVTKVTTKCYRVYY